MLTQIFELFHKGGYVMWPMLLLSLVGVTVVIERVIFYARHQRRRQVEHVTEIMNKVEVGDFDGAIALGKGSRDYVSNILAAGLAERHLSLDDALAKAAAIELNHMNQGLPIMDTVVTAAPLLGLLGTVTGMMKSFFGLGEGLGEAGAGVLTGGIAEALIATACALAVAFFCLVPYNYCHSRVEQARHDIEDSFHRLALAMKKQSEAAAA